MSKISFLDCPHRNVQQFTECCLDCGHNTWTTEKEYLQWLKDEVKRNRELNDPTIKEIRRLEEQLGIQRVKK